MGPAQAVPLRLDTGLIDTRSRPCINGNVEAVTYTADGQSILIAGAFTTVNGQPAAADREAQPRRHARHQLQGERRRDGQGLRPGRRPADPRRRVRQDQQHRRCAAWPRSTPRPARSTTTFNLADQRVARRLRAVRPGARRLRRRQVARHRRQLQEGRDADAPPGRGHRPAGRQPEGRAVVDGPLRAPVRVGLQRHLHPRHRHLAGQQVLRRQHDRRLLRLQPHVRHHRAVGAAADQDRRRPGADVGQPHRWRHLLGGGDHRVRRLRRRPHAVVEQPPPLAGRRQRRPRSLCRVPGSRRSTPTRASRCRGTRAATAVAASRRCTPPTTT